MQGHPALTIPFGTRDLAAVQTTGYHHFHAQGTETHGVLHRAFHGAAEHDAFLKLLGDVLGHELRVNLRLAHFLDRHLHRMAGQLGQFLAHHFNVFALLANHNTRARGVQRDADVLGRTLNHNLAECGMGQLLLEVFAQLDVRRQVGGIVFAARVPLCGPVADNTETKTVWVDLLSHYLLPFFTDLSLTVMVIWLVRFRICTPRPLARA